MINKYKWLVAQMGIAVLAVMVIYGQTLAYPFMLLDDPNYVLNDPATQEISFENIETIFTTPRRSAWYPLTRLSHAVDIFFFGKEAAGHRSVNILLHSINAFLIFSITAHFLRIFKSPQTESERWCAQIAAAFAALVFLIHPQHVEPTVWVTQRNELLAGLFFMTAVLVYLRQHGKRATLKQHTLIFFLGLLAMLSKPTSVILPVILLLMDLLLLNKTPVSSHASYWPLLRDSLQRHSGLFVLSTLISMAALKFHNNTGSLLLTELYPLSVRVQYALFNYYRMMLDFFIPTGLAPARDIPGFIDGSWPVLAALLTIAILLFVLLKILGGRGVYLAFLLLYVGISYLPTSGIIMFGTYSPADRWAYLPTLPFYVLSAFAVVYLFEWFSVRLVSVMLCVVLLSGTFLANQQARLWQSDFVLWNHVVKHYPRNAIALYYVGNLYYRAGKFEQAILYYEQALTVGPVYKMSPVFSAFAELASIYQLRGNWLLASESLQRALPYDSSNADLYGQIGQMELTAGNTDRANRFFEQAAQMRSKRR